MNQKVPARFKRQYFCAKMSPREDQTALLPSLSQGSDLSWRLHFKGGCMIRDKELLESAKSGPRKAGRKELISYLEGGKISRPGAVKAKCYDCSGMGDQGKCDLEHCPLYPFSPYRTRNRAVSVKSEGTDTETGVSNAQSTNSKSQNSKETIINEVSNG